MFFLLLPILIQDYPHHKKYSGIVLPAIRSYGSKIGVSWSDLLLSNILVNLDGLTYDSEFFKPLSSKVALNPVSRLSLLFGLL